MPFERFTKVGRGYKPKVSIWSKGQIGFNQGAVLRLNLKKYKFAILFYDQESRRVGLRFTNDINEDGAVKLHVRKTGAVISARSFLDYYGIDYSKKQKYDVDYDKENNLYVISLATGLTNG